ncbi:hypothetical protein WJX81_006837 [Elliptochloris bilobata]|uniref:O-phosphoseryl-tRNA(Sec) selenium transferase n=1 Tax=Elliptochloris bilobata TaxID=381761 RepID=A0AAW1RE41_9CHLO
MNADNCALARGLVSPSYVAQGAEALAKRQKLVKAVLSQRRLPQAGWDDATIELFIQEVALMDSNNFVDNVGVGEREARVACDLVARRHYRLAHGIGRSGDVGAEQPKAAGSSLLARLANLLVADALTRAGLADLGASTVLPLATGMALTLTLLALRPLRPAGARYVLWPRIDQKTCLKAIMSAGLEAVPLALALVGDELRTDLAALEAELRRLGPANVVAVVITTSCFAPRAADDIVAVARVCEAHDVGHVINNAYGVQSAALCKLVTAAWRRGRVDAVVQSTDKNFMVPVGGAVVAAGRRRPGLVAAVNKAYPGRASMAPLLDVLMTLLHWGAPGWAAALAAREQLFWYAQEALDAFATRHGERLLRTPGNPISLALTLDTLGSQVPPPVAFLGSMLFKRCVSGTRVVARGKAAVVAGHSFVGYGAHCDAYPHDYLTFAAALGTTRADVDAFVRRLEQCFAEFRARRASAGGAEG